MTKEEIKQAAESNWDEINSQFKYGLNPYAHRVGFIEGVKWATERLKADKNSNHLNRSLELLDEFIRDNPEELNEIIAKHVKEWVLMVILKNLK